MEVIINEINHFLKIEDYIDGKSCFFDIETTGLSRKKDIVYLVGIVYWNFQSKNWTIKQFFAESKSEELKILEESVDFISKFDNIISYNGQSFDIPFVNQRLKNLSSKKEININKSFDIYRIVKSNKDFLNLENLKLKTIEEYLGYYREDMYTGYDCIKFYKDFLTSNNKEYKNNILKHNYDDLIHMLDIIKIIDILKEKKTLSFKINEKDHSCLIDSLEFKNNSLQVKGIINPPLDYNLEFYSFNYSIYTKSLVDLYFNIDIHQGMVDENTLANFINISNFPINVRCKYNEFYPIPNSIFLLSLNKKPLVKNIKNLIINLISEI